MAVLEGGLLFRSTFASAGAGGKHRGRQLGGKGGMAVLEGGLLFRSTFALAGAHRWSIPTPGARRSEHQRGALCRCALSIIQRFLVEDSEQVQVSHSLARDDRLEVHVGKGKEVALRASFRPLPHAAGRVAGVTVRGKEEQGRRAGAIEGWCETEAQYGGCCPTIDGSREAAVLTR